MLKLIGGALGALFLYAAYKLATADGRPVAPPDSKAPAPAPAKPGVTSHHG